jgi:hypothetical protein
MYAPISRLIADVRPPTAPVDLSFLDDLYTVQYAPFAPNLRGFMCPDEEDPTTGLIVVNSNLHPYEQRAAKAHEAAHFLLHHDAQVCTLSNWHKKRQERFAQYAASMILVPWHYLLDMTYDGATVAQMADELEVPQELLFLRQRFQDITTEHQRSG